MTHLRQILSTSAIDRGAEHFSLAPLVRSFLSNTRQLIYCVMSFNRRLKEVGARSAKVVAILCELARGSADRSILTWLGLSETESQRKSKEMPREGL